MSNRKLDELLPVITKELAFIPLSMDLYQELESWLQKERGSGGPGAVAALADHQLRFFLERMYEENLPPSKGRSVYWSDPTYGGILELPHGTEIRTSHLGEWKVARVSDGEIVWNGKGFHSPSQACNSMRGDSSNNAWLTLEVKRPQDTKFRSAKYFRKNASTDKCI